MAGINVPGLGSGLDIAGMSSGLAQAEMGGFIKEAQRQKSTTTSQISSLSKISGALSNFQGTLDSLNIAEMTRNTLTYPDPEKVISITASGRAINGNYDVEVLSLASSHRLKSQEFTDTQMFQGTLSISTNTDSFSLSVPEGSSIFALAQQINSETEGLSVVVVDNGNGNVLSISSETTGTDGTIEITGVDDPSVPASELSKLTFNSSAQTLTEVKQASDSIIKINGVEIVSSDNNFNDAITGLEISVNNNVAAEKIGEIQEFSIQKNNSGIKTQVRQFVSDYNSIIGGIKAMSSYDVDNDSAGVFNGDADIRILTQRLSTAMTSPIENAIGQYNTLYSIGVKSTDTGSFTIDDSMLNSAIENDEDSVLSLLASGLNSNHDGITIDSELTADTNVFTEDLTITKMPTPASASAVSTEATNPYTTPFSITSGIDLFFDGALLVAALGEGGDNLDFSNYTDFIAQINIDLSTNNVPIQASFTSSALGSIPETFLASIKFEQSNPIEGDLTINSLGSLSSFTPEASIPTAPGIISYQSQDYDHYNSFTIPDQDVDLIIDPEAVNIPDELKITSSKGFAYLINDIVNNYIDGEDSILKTKGEALKNSKDRISTRIEELNEKRDKVEARYLKQFQALDIALVRMKQQSEALNGQLDSISALTDSINRG